MPGPARHPNPGKQPKPPRGYRRTAEEEARFRRDHPGEHRRRGGWTSRWERAVKAIDGALDVADELDIQPHEALLMGVRIAAFKVATHERRYGEVLAEHDGRVEDPEVRLIARESRLERALLWKNSKAAVDAGLSERLVAQVELDQRVVVHTLGATLNAILAHVGTTDQAERDLRLWVHDAVAAILRAHEEGVDVPAIEPPPVQLAVVTVDDGREPSSDGPRSSPARPSTSTTSNRTDDDQHDDPGPATPAEPETVDAEVVEPQGWVSHGRWR
jgi:hypothetical protein